MALTLAQLALLDPAERTAFHVAAVNVAHDQPIQPATGAALVLLIERLLSEDGE